MIKYLLALVILAQSAMAQYPYGFVVIQRNLDDSGSEFWVLPEYTNKIAFWGINGSNNASDSYYFDAGFAFSGNALSVTKSSIGLGNVDNTSDVNKPVSTATQTALDLKANSSALAAVAFSGAYSDLAGKPTLLTAAVTNGLATSNQVVAAIGSLGTAAFTAASDYATTAQGTKADSAIQSGNNISLLANNSGFITAATAPVTSVNGFTGAVSLGASNLVGVSQFTWSNLVAQSSAVAWRGMLGAGTSSFSGIYNDLTDKPTIPTLQLIQSTNILSAANGTVTWTFPTPYPFGQVPNVCAVAVTNAGLFNVQVTGKTTNGCTISANKMDNGISILGISVLTLVSSQVSFDLVAVPQ